MVTETERLAQSPVERKVKIVIPEPHSEEQRGFIGSGAKRKIIRAGRRFGKTYGVAIEDLMAFCGVCAGCFGEGLAPKGVEGCERCGGSGKVTPKRVLYMAPTSEQVDAYWKIISKALSDGVDLGVFKKNETEKFIEVEGTEQRIKAKTAWNANTARGDYADKLTFEEFQLMNEDAWEEVGLPMLLDNNGDATFIYTPPSLKSEGVSKAKDPRHASKMFAKALADTTGRWQTFHFTSYQNPLLSQEALADISSEMSLEAQRREILAEEDDIQTSWLVYGKFAEDVCKIKRFTIPDSWPVTTGHDFGTANPAALFVAKVLLPLPDGAPKHLRYGDYVAFKEYAPGGGLSEIQHIQKWREIIGKRKIEISTGGNITTEEEIRRLYGAQGWPIVAPLLSRVNAQIDKVYAVMERNKLFIFEDLYILLSQIAGCMWELDEENKPTNKIKNESRYHFLSCLRYLATFLPAETNLVPTERPKVKIW